MLRHNFIYDVFKQSITSFITTCQLDCDSLKTFIVTHQHIYNLITTHLQPVNTFIIYKNFKRIIVVSKLIGL